MIWFPWGWAFIIRQKMIAHVALTAPIEAPAGKATAPLRILFIGPGSKGRYGLFYYSTDKKLRNGFTRQRHNCFLFSDREAASFTLGMRALGKRRANRSFNAIAESFRPQLIVLFLAHIIEPETLRAYRAAHPDCRIVNVEVDLIESEERLDRHRAVAGVVDATFLTSGGAPLKNIRALGHRVSYLPNPIDRSIECVQSYSHDNHTHDIVYVSGAPEHSERWKPLDDLEAERPDLRIGRFGAGKNRILGDEYFKLLYASRAALNWSAKNDIELYSSDRISQLFGSGNLVCTSTEAGFQRFLGPDTTIFFKDTADLAQQLDAAFASDSWRDIAERGQARYTELFNEERIADYIIKFAFEEDVSSFEWADV